MADIVPRPQWPRPTGSEPAVPTAPFTTIPNITHAIRHICDTVTIIPFVSVARRYLGRVIEGGAEEENIISQEATTVHGWQRTEGYHVTE